MRFLCDAMLADIGKRLRMAGYDTRIDEGLIGDYELVLLAREEGRWLLTRDRSIREIKEARPLLVYLASQKREDWIRHLTAELGVNWLFAPMSRCLECNCLLKPAGPEARELAPDSVREEGRMLWECPECRKVYWEGSHARNMRKALGASAEPPA